MSPSPGSGVGSKLGRGRFLRMHLRVGGLIAILCHSGLYCCHHGIVHRSMMWMS